jgi:hypothetical protein
VRGYAKRGKHRTEATEATEVTEGEIGWAVEDCFGELGGPLKTVLVNTATSGAAKREIIDAFLFGVFRTQANGVPRQKIPALTQIPLCDLRDLCAMPSPFA